MEFLNLPGLSGWVSMAFTIIMLFLGVLYTNKTAKSKAKAAVEEAQKSAETAQNSAIGAMQAEINSLRGQMEDEKKENARGMKLLHKENTRLEHIIDTICSALKTQGIIITINGEIINISIEDPRKITTVRIQDVKDEVI